MGKIAFNHIVQIVVQIMENVLITNVIVIKISFMLIAVLSIVLIIAQEMVNVIKDIVSVSLDLTGMAANSSNVQMTVPSMACVLMENVSATRTFLD